jgi:hypothetical protein
MSDSESETETIFNEKADVGGLQPLFGVGDKVKKPISEAKSNAIKKAQAARKVKAAAARELGIKKPRKKVKKVESESEEDEKPKKNAKVKDDLVNFNQKNLSFFNRNEDDPLLYTVREQGKIIEEMHKKLNKMYQYNKIKRENKQGVKINDVSKPEKVEKSILIDSSAREHLARLILGSRKK